MKKVESKEKRISANKIIYLVGEGTGETITKIARAALAQFHRENVRGKELFSGDG